MVCRLAASYFFLQLHKLFKVRDFALEIFALFYWQLTACTIATTTADAFSMFAKTSTQ